MFWTLAGIALVLLGIGCATLLHSTTQQVSMSRTSMGTYVATDNVPTGQTQSMTNLPRKDQHVVKIVVPGSHHRKRHATLRAGRGVMSVLLASLVFH